VPELFLRIWVATTTRVERDPKGQTTAEYALVLLCAAAIATLVLAWATNTNAISRLFDVVIDKVIPR
jgi:hypothetical protein